MPADEAAFTGQGPGAMPGGAPRGRKRARAWMLSTAGPSTTQPRSPSTKARSNATTALSSTRSTVAPAKPGTCSSRAAVMTFSAATKQVRSVNEMQAGSDRQYRSDLKSKVHLRCVAEVASRYRARNISVHLLFTGACDACCFIYFL